MTEHRPIRDRLGREADGSELVTTDPAVAADRLAAGGVAALPTETVYGLAADATNDTAIGRVFEIKGRPTWHPLIVHFGSPEPDRWVSEGWIGQAAWLPQLHELADAFWPGPLTAIVPAGRRVSRAVTGGRDTVGIRVPRHRATERALTLLDRPVAAPSANRFGRVSPTDVEHVIADIGELLTPGADVVLDGGKSECGVESTIIDLTVDPPQLLRHGAIDPVALAAVVGAIADAAGPARASGMLAAHYAPTGFVVIAGSAVEAEFLAADFEQRGLAVEIVDRSADADEAARRLYADLRRADSSSIDGIIVVPPPDQGIGTAVRDRLQRAATGSTPPNPTR